MILTKSDKTPALSRSVAHRFPVSEDLGAHSKRPLSEILDLPLDEETSVPALPLINDHRQRWCSVIIGIGVSGYNEDSVLLHTVHM